MRDNEYLEWEREQYLRRKKYKGKRKRNPKLICAIIAAIIAIVYATFSVFAEDNPVPVKHEKVEMPEIEVQIIEPTPMEHLGEFRVSFYCSASCCCGEWADGITATGTTATEGRTIAVDPNVIPLGSEVALFYDDGSICYYTAEDIGGAIKENRIDVFMESHEEALERGIAGASVYLVNEEG